MRTIDPDEVRANASFAKLADLAAIFNHEIIEDDGGTWRWRPNCLIGVLVNDFPVRSDRPSPLKRKRLSFDVLLSDLSLKRFTVEEFMKLHMQAGHTLAGFNERFGQHDAMDFWLAGAGNVVGPDGYRDTVIEYMVRAHAGRVLKL